MSAPLLIIGGIALPQRSRLDYQQTLERVDGGSSSRRLASGALHTSTRWQRWKTSISGSGWVPAPLLSLPVGSPFAVHSVAPIALLPGENLPAGWQARTDVQASEVTDERGVTIRFIYPILTVVSRLGARQALGDEPSWQLDCEEP